MSEVIAEVEVSRFDNRQNLSSAEPPALPMHVARHLLSGTSALGAAVVVERGLGFLANLLAARLSNASTFGAYSLAIATANNISSYAAGGIGSTAVRFSGKYPRTSTGYLTLSKALMIISLISACVAAGALWAGAAPLANLLGRQSLTGLLRWSALSAAGILLLECCRGFFVGQRRTGALLLLSLAVGIGMLALLPLASRLGPTQMIWSQGGTTLAAVGICLLLYRPLGLAAVPSVRQAEPLGPMLKTVWSFGLVQLAGLIGMNAAGWWLTSLVARADTSMVQIGFLAIAQQLRNVVSLAPNLLTESSLAVMARGEEDIAQTPNQVMAVCTLANTFAALLLAGIGIVFVPWGLSFLYGKNYAGASAVVAVALATAVIHMGNSPAAGRLSILSIRLTGIVNTIWALVVAAGATMFFFWHGNACRGALIYLGAHLLSATLIIRMLRKFACVPKGMTSVFTIGAGASVILALLSIARLERPELAWLITSLMLLLYFAALGSLFVIGRRKRWVPTLSSFRKFFFHRQSQVAPGTLSSEGGLDA